MIPSAVRVGSGTTTTTKGVSGAPSAKRPCSRMIAVHASSTDHPVTATPHSAFHYDESTTGRCFEGWYLRVTLPDRQSLAFIHCIEDPGADSELSKVSSQVMWDIGPGEEGYLIQHTRDVGAFWANKDIMEFGAVYDGSGGLLKEPISPEEFLKSVNSGFQASDSLHTGVLHATSPDGDMLREVLDEAQQTPSSAQTIRWAYTMNPVYTWGGSVPSEEHGTEQDGNLKSTNGNEDEDTAVDGKSTTGWMALSPAFDPQWQICLAHATATGWVEIDGRKIEFEDVAAYVEKNWGAGFPPKWFWLQSNLFEGHPDLTVTAVGAKKRTVQPVGGFVDVGLIGIHFENEFIECVPWNAAMAWQVDPWGSWKMSGGSATYEVELSVSAEGDGTWLRGPHDHAGFVPFCKDGFNGQMELRVWQRPGLLGKILAALADLFGMQKSRPRGKLVVEAHSAACAVECGGEPWDGTWESECTVPQLLLDTLRNPVDGDKVADAVGGSNDSS